jgi:long-chain acyl-CoA synthetase
MDGAGIRQGDRVALLVGNRVEWFDATLGLLKAGAVRTYINPRHTPPEIAYQVADSGASVLFVSDESRPLLDGADLSGVRDVIEIGDDYERLLARQDPDRAPAEVDDDHPCEIRYTSGTTGRPKGAVHTHRSWTTLSMGSMYHLGPEDDDVLLHVGPMSHASGGYCIPMLLAGGRQVIHRGFDPVELVHAIPQHGVTSMLLVPTMIYMLLDTMEEQGIDGSTIRTIVYGAAPMSPQKLERCLDMLGPVFLQGYGMSEVLGGMTYLDKRDHIPGDPRLASCGRPSILGEVMIVDEDGNEAPIGEAGEIWMRGPTRLKEYWNRPDATAAALAPGGWFRSGDVARMDEHGYIYIVDRKADMIVSGGFNVYPAEVEHTLMEHPAVWEVAVIAVPDDKWGEAVRAVVRVRDGQTLDGPELLDWARQRLAGYKLPKSVEFCTEELPKNASGKLQRRQLREPYWAGVERRVG